MKFWQIIIWGFLLLSARISIAQALVPFPNPFLRHLTLRTTLPVVDTASIYVYNITGSKVRTLFSDSILPAGQYDFAFDSDSLPGGIYIFELQISHLRIMVKAIKSSGPSAINIPPDKEMHLPFPNPCTNAIYIPVHNLVANAMTISDINGRKMQIRETGISDGILILDLSDLPIGPYLLKLDDDSMYKFIKQ